MPTDHARAEGLDPVSAAGAPETCGPYWHINASPSHAEGAWCNACNGTFAPLNQFTGSEFVDGATPYLVDGRGRPESSISDALHELQRLVERAHDVDGDVDDDDMRQVLNFIGEVRMLWKYNVLVARRG